MRCKSPNQSLQCFTLKITQIILVTFLFLTSCLHQSAACSLTLLPIFHFNISILLNSPPYLHPSCFSLFFFLCFYVLQFTFCTHARFSLSVCSVDFSLAEWLINICWCTGAAGEPCAYPNDCFCVSLQSMWDCQ